MSDLLPLIARDIDKSYGDRAVLSGVDLTASPGRPLGVVGENGVGKSTLLRVLVGIDSADAGAVERPTDLGYVGQTLDLPADSTVASVLRDALTPLHDAVRHLEDLATALAEAGAEGLDAYADALAWAQHHNAWDADRRALRAAARLGLDRIEPDRPVAQMSGGERTRLALAALITRQPGCVVLDEPSNHLDDSAVEFLEDFLTTLPGVAVIASHDRTLLDNVCHSIVDLDPAHHGKDDAGTHQYTGGFTPYLEHKRTARRRWERAFAEQQDEFDRLRQQARTTARQVAHNRAPRDNDKFIYHFKGANVQATIRRRVRNAENRIVVLEREQIPKPPAQLHFDHRSTATNSGKAGSVISVRMLDIPGRLRLDHLDVRTGEHVLVTGTNGAGKSTLLDVLARRLEPTTGRVDVRARRIGLLSQEVDFARPDRTVLETFAAAVPDARLALTQLGLLHPRELSRPVGALSVGQQRRLALAVLVAGGPDLLLLDEPTNHISLALASELEQALDRSTGSVVVASHDRWLRSRWRGSQLHLDGNRLRPSA